MAITPICLTVEHVATEKFISLQKIKISSFKDTLDTKYSSEEVFGRMDPIMTYQGTTRNISFSFDMGSDTVENMSLAQVAVQKLMQFQYPVYDPLESGALALSRPPLLRVKFANYIQAENGAGLLCAMKGMSYNPIDNFAIDRSPRIVNGNIVPIRISVSMELTVLHEAPVGWQINSPGEFSGAAFLDLEPGTTISDTGIDTIINDEGEAEFRTSAAWDETAAEVTEALERKQGNIEIAAGAGAFSAPLPPSLSAEPALGD
jgi:hypothetical protein